MTIAANTLALRHTDADAPQRRAAEQMAQAIMASSGTERATAELVSGVAELAELATSVQALHRRATALVARYAWRRLVRQAEPLASCSDTHWHAYQKAIRIHRRVRLLRRRGAYILTRLESTSAIIRSDISAAAIRLWPATSADADAYHQASALMALADETHTMISVADDATRHAIEVIRLSL